MAFKLPDFTNTHCQSIGACGSVKTKSKKALEIVDGKPRRYSSHFTMGKHDAWLLVLLGDDDVEHHLHMEVVREDRTKFRPGAVEERPIADVQLLLRPMIGRTVAVVANGTFIVPIKDLPDNSLIRPRFFKVRNGKTSITTTSMIFDIEWAVAPIRLRWQQIDEENILVELVANLRGKIDEDYLVRFFKLLNTAFRAFVLGKTNDNEPVTHQLV